MNIKNFRRYHKLTQSELSELLQMSKVYVTKTEIDKNGIIPRKNYNAILTIEKVLGRYRTHRTRLKALEREHTRLETQY